MFETKRVKAAEYAFLAKELANFLVFERSVMSNVRRYIPT
jgi:hypothetical protein